MFEPREGGVVAAGRYTLVAALARGGMGSVIKVLDFGIVKATELGDAQADTASGMLLGSVHYTSPEQMRSSRAVDQRSDLWSVGVILYRMVTGELPFPGTDIGDVIVRVCTDRSPPPSSVAPDLPASIDVFFERALARDPDRRFQTAQELAEAFGAAGAPSAPCVVDSVATAVPSPPPSPPAAARPMIVAVGSTVSVSSLPAGPSGAPPVPAPAAAASVVTSPPKSSVIVRDDPFANEDPVKTPKVQSSRPAEPQSPDVKPVAPPRQGNPLDNPN